MKKTPTFNLHTSSFILQRGFTLLEILVAMTLVALVTLIAVTAFKLTVQAWGRVSEEGESRQIQSALPTLLENQLMAQVKMPILGDAKLNPATYFCGGENSLSFITAYAPRGSLLQGMSCVSYRFDPEQKTLFIYQRVITRLDDLAVIVSGLGSNKTEEGLPVSQIQGISDFSLAYTSELLYDPNDLRQWQGNWGCGADSAGVPVGLMLKMTIGEGRKARSFTWIYWIADLSYPGGQQSLSPFGGK